ncbi:DUF2156 domain-containing protein [Mediannikoviicoccus vaginalis]|uniref:DUF2156 domain-containing protein n=1 Tax=Mediannikoviicoccus vaginalis TaxID=2899727 RepID=UPI001F3E688D|nr:DUF2156 domain-containing protein [Mediannikoviicoccus vaginalis]
MIYEIKIDKYVNDRFKVYKAEDDSLVVVGEKVGDPGSYFDAFVNETVSRGAEFVFYDETKKEILRIKRHFYSEDKKYVFFEGEKETGHIVSRLEGSDILIDFDYKNIEEHMSLPKGAKEFYVEGLGRIKSLKQGFKPYEKMEIQVEHEKDFKLLMAIAVYIWDVFIKNKVAFV